jgi:preprotein translocase subunit YajC
VGELTPLLLLAALLLLFWLVVIRPARRQQSTVSELQRNLAVGDRVVLSAGIFGTIVTLDDTRVQLEIAPGTVIEVARQVVVRRAEDSPQHEDLGLADPDESAETTGTSGTGFTGTDTTQNTETTDFTDRPDAGKA